MVTITTSFNLKKSDAPASPIPKKQKVFIPEEIAQFHHFQTLFQNSDQFFPISEKRFGLVLGDSFITNTSLEGGDPYQSYKYWMELLKQFQAGECFLKVPLEDDEIELLMENVKDCIEVNIRLKSGTEKDLKELGEYINNRLNRPPYRCVIPLSHKGSGVGGHVHASIFQRNNEGEILVTHLNKGDGAERHLKGSVINKLKYYYNFGPYKLMDPHYFESSSSILFLKLLERFYHTEAGEKEKIKSSEFYDLFTVFASLHLSDAVLDFSEVTLQRGGSCSEQVTRLLLRDQLLQKNPAQESIEQYKKVIFISKFQALFNGYRSNIPPKLLLKGCEEFALSTLKMDEAGLLTPEDWIKCTALIELVRQDAKEALKSESKESTVPKLNQEMSEITKISFKPITKIERKNKNLKAKKPFNFTAPTPDKFLHYIHKFQKRIGGMHFREDWYKFKAFVLALPVPKTHNDPYWELIPQDKVEECLSKISILLNGAKSSHQFNYVDYKDMLIVNMGITAIADKLARRLPQLKLDSFKFEFLKEPAKFFFIQLGHEYQKYQEILTYYEDLDKEHKYEIFSYALGETRATERIESSDFQTFRTDPSTVVRRQLLYVDQFLVPTRDRTNDLINFQHFIRLGWPNFQSPINNSLNIVRHMFYRLNHLIVKSKGWVKYSWEDKLEFLKNSNSGHFCDEKLHVLAIKDGLELLKSPPESNHREKTKIEPKDSPCTSRIYPIKKVFLASILNNLGNGLEPCPLPPNENMIMMDQFKDVTLPSEEGKDELTTKMIHDLRKIAAQEELRIPALILWCNENKVLLEDSDYKNIVETILLRDCHQDLRREPLLLESIRKMISNQLDYVTLLERYQESLFWLRLAYHIETQAKVILPNTKFSEKAESLQIQLNQLLNKIKRLPQQAITEDIFKGYETLIRLHKAYFASADGEWDHQQILNFVTNDLFFHFVEEVLPPELEWIKYEVQSFRQKHLQALYQSFLKDSELLLKCLYIHFKNLNIDGTIEQLNLEEFPHVKFQIGSQNYLFNFSEAILYRESIPLRKSSLLEKLCEDMPQLRAVVGKPLPTVFDISDLYPDVESAFESQDGNLRGFIINRKKNHFLLQKKFSKDDKAQFYYWMQNTPLPSVFKSFDCWISEENDSCYQMIITKADGSIFAEGNFSQHDTDFYGLIYKKNSDLETEYYIPFEEDEDWKAFLSSFTDIKEIMAWGKKNKGNLELSSFSVTSLQNLTFNLLHNDSKPIVVCDRFPEYKLSNKQETLGDTHLQGVLNLEKRNDPAKKALLAFYLFYKSGQYFDVIPQWSTDGLASSRKDSDEGFIFYEQDEHTGLFRCKSQTGMLYLIYLFLRVGKYEEAVEYVDHLQWDHLLTHQDYQILGCCQQDASPQSAALNLKLALKVLENMNLPHFKLNVGTVNKDELKEYWKLIISFLKSYLQNSDHAYLQNLAPSLRLTDLEKYELLKEINRQNVYNVSLTINSNCFFLHDQHLICEWGKLNELSKQKYHFIKKTITLPNFHESIRNLIPHIVFDEKQFPKPEITPLKEVQIRYPSQGTILEHFYWLVEEAKVSHSNDMDLYLFSFFNDLLNAKKCSISDKHTPFEVKLVAIVYLIKCFPEKFKGENPPSNNDPKLWEDYFKRLIVLYDSLKARLGSFQNDQKIEKNVNVTVPYSLNKPEVRISQFKDALPAIASISFSYESPLRDIYEKFYTSKENPILKITEKPFVLKPKKIFEKDPLLESVLSNLTKNYNEKVKDKTYQEYILQENSEELKDVLPARVASLQQELAQLRTKMDELTGYPNEEELKDIPNNSPSYLHYRLEIASKQKLSMALEDPLILSLLARDRTLLTKRNPFLTEKKCIELQEITLSYLLTASALDQAKEALADPSTTPQVLSKKRHYDPTQYPELLLYEYASGNILREEPNQAELLIEIFRLAFSVKPIDKVRMRKLFFEFQAGGGKTKVISTLIALKAILVGKLPIFFSLPELHDITKKDLRESLSKLLQINVHETKLGLHTHPKANQLETIYHHLIQAQQKGLCEIITPESFHTLQIEYQMALKRKDVEIVKWLSLIDDFFLQHCVIMVDEFHRNGDSLYQYNITAGQPGFIDEADMDLALFCYDFLAKEADLGLKCNQQALVSDDILKRIFKDLAKKLVSHPLLGVPEEKQADTMDYLLNEKLSPPDWLLKWKAEGKSFSTMIALARGFLTTILSHSIKLVGEMDYGKSIHPNNLVEAPRKQKNPTTAKFENPDIAMALCIQGLLQRGISSIAEMKLFVKFLKQKALNELKKGMTINQTPIAKTFMAWQGSENPKITLEQVSEDLSTNDAYLNQLILSVGKNWEAIKLYLKKIVLPQIEIYPSKYTSNTQDMLAGFYRLVMFSATLGNVEQYTTLDIDSEHYLEDLSFQAEVIQRACLEHNTAMHWLQPSTPKKLFEDLYEKNKNLFDRLEGSLDLGGWNKNYSGFEIAQQFLTFVEEKQLPFDGVTYFHEEVRSDNTREKSLYYLHKTSKEPIKLDSTHIAKEITRKGITASRIFKIYGPEDTTGTDLTLAKEGKMLFILGEGATLSSMIQTIMRMRQFLKAPINAELAQCLVWIGSLQLGKQIAMELKSQMAEIDPVKCFEWGFLQEVKRRKDVIIQRAYQEIQGCIREIVRSELRHRLYKPEKQIEYFHEANHYKAYELPIGRDPFETYAYSTSEEDIKLVLTEFAENFAKNCGVDVKKGTKARWDIDQIIIMTQNKVLKVPYPAKKMLSSTAQMETKAEKTTEELNKNKHKKLSNEAFAGFTAAPLLDYTQNVLSLNNPLINEQSSNFHFSVNKAFSVGFFSKDLGITTNALKTVIEDVQVYKPYEYFLVIEDKGLGKKALAVSQFDAIEYRRQLTAGIVNKDRAATLFTSDGGIVQNGFSLDALKELQSSEWFKTIIFDLNLMKGKIVDSVRMKELLTENFAECDKYWKNLTEKSLDSDDMDHFHFDTLKKGILENDALSLLEDSETEDLSKDQMFNTDLTAKIKNTTHQTPNPHVTNPQTSNPLSLKMSRGRFVKHSLFKLLQRHSWLIPFCFLTLGILPLILAIYYAFKYKNNDSISIDN